jgi:hypothetical protein
MRRLLIASFLLLMGCSSGRSPSPPPPPDQAAAAAAREPPPAIPQDIADSSFPWPLTVADAEKILFATDVFDIADPSYRPGRQIHAFNVLLDQTDVRDRLLRLADKGRAAGRLYALCGLLLVARKEGIRFAHSLSLTAGNVTVREGDFWFDTPTVRAIVLIFVDQLPERLRASRANTYEYFRRAG